MRLSLFFLILSIHGFSQNPFVGTWTSYKIEALSRKAQVVEKAVEMFNSEIVFYADSTFTKLTNFHETKGRYEVRENWLIFYVLNKENKWETAFSMRWPKGEKDPVSRTPEFDFVYPEILPIIDRKGKETIGDVEVYYKKAGN